MFTVSPQTLLSLLEGWSWPGYQNLRRSRFLWAMTENKDKPTLPDFAKRGMMISRSCSGPVNVHQCINFFSTLQTGGLLGDEVKFELFKNNFLILTETCGWFERNILSKAEYVVMRNEMRLGPMPIIFRTEPIPKVVFFKFSQYEEAVPVEGYRFAEYPDMWAMDMEEKNFSENYPKKDRILGSILKSDFHIPRSKVWLVPHIKL